MPSRQKTSVTMPSPASRKPRLPIKPAMLLLLLSAPILAACGSLGLTAHPAAETVSPDAKPVVAGQQVTLRPFSCSEYKPVTRHLGKITPDGKPDISQQDVLDGLKRPDWLPWLHRVFGDTNETLGANQVNNDVWHRLCDPTPG